MTEDQFPPAFIKSVQAQVGDEWNNFLEAHQEPSPVSIRNNPRKTSPEAESIAIPWSNHGSYLQERPSFTLDPSLHAGSYYVQEASSMFLEQAFTQVAAIDEPLNVLDLCAAPGGKSTHLLSLMKSNSLLVSNEVIQSRAAILSENIQKWGYNNVVVTNNDPADFQRLSGFFDVIVVDAPCSGEGLFRKDSSAIKEWSEEQIMMCSKRQRRILNDVWPSLKTGGILIYSTCTYNEFENEENLKWLQQEYDMESIPLKIKDEWSIQEVKKDTVTGYRFFPHRLSGEGFFMAVLRKNNDTESVRLGVKNIFTDPSKKTVAILSEWILNATEKKFIIRNDTIQFLPQNKIREIETIAKNLRIIIAGTYLAAIKHDKYIPEHGAALSIELNRKTFHCISLNLEEALQYLRKDALSIPSHQKGFALMTYENLSLGWANVLENRINNLYPSEWRIRIR